VLFTPNFQHLIHRFIYRVNQGGPAWDTDLVLEQNCALKRIFSNGNSIQKRAINLTSWARAREYRDGEAGYLQERAWHLIPTREIASLQLGGTDGRRRKLSKALLIKRQTKRADNHASLQDVVRDHLLAATGVKRCTSRTSAKTRAGFVVFAIGSDPNRSACCTVAISSWPLHNQKMRSFATAHGCGIPSIPTHYSNRVGKIARRSQSLERRKIFGRA
jgi:hypothetical protein